MRQPATISALRKGAFLTALVLMTSAAFAQTAEKVRLRMRTTYIQIVDGPVYLDLQTSARIDRSNVDVPNLDLEVYYEVDGEEFPLGTVRTNAEGKARLTLSGISALQPDSTGLYILGASFGGNDQFRRGSSSVEFRNASLKASLQERDSVYYVRATLSDQALDSVVADALVKVQVQRMFRPLRISEDLLMTDQDGSIRVEVPLDIPAPEGNLPLEVVLEDHETYGTVIARINAPIGVPIAQDDSAEANTLWAPRNRTPIFILVFTGLLVFGSWGLILYLIRNLFKIAKS